MRVTYDPKGINNFHNVSSIHLIIPPTRTFHDGEHKYFVVSARQAKRIGKHFCGVKECRCAAGAVVPIDDSDTWYAIRMEFCR